MMVYLASFHFVHVSGRTYTPADPEQYPIHADNIRKAIAKREDDPEWTRVEGKPVR